MVLSKTRITMGLRVDCANAQAGLRLCCSQATEDRFSFIQSCVLALRHYQQFFSYISAVS